MITLTHIKRPTGVVVRTLRERGTSELTRELYDTQQELARTRQALAQTRSELRTLVTLLASGPTPEAQSQVLSSILASMKET